MGRNLTRVDIGGTLFEVDAFREVLRQRDDPENRIPFHVFDQEGDGYRFLYDMEGRCLPESKQAVLAAPERYCWVIIPALMELDPEGVAMRYGIPVDVLCPENENLIPKEITAVVKPVSVRTRDEKRKQG